MAYVKGGKKCNLVQSWRRDWNSSYACGKQTILAQTFPIDEDTHIASIFLKTFCPWPPWGYFCDIRATDDTGRPYGPNLATKYGFWEDEVLMAPGTWKMFFYNDFPLLTPGQYAIVFSSPTAPTTSSVGLSSYKEADYYHAGRAWLSYDNGLNWELLSYRTFNFEVWGWPPPPDPPPEPAISNWAPTDIESELTPSGYTIVVTTDIPCHLYMRWTTTEPRKHPSEVFRRGIRLMAGVRWCFVSFKENEQEEEGDTLVHTFIKPDWPVCETRWFYFYGQKQSIESPSASPIFHLHRERIGLQLIFLEPWSEYAPPPPPMELIFLEPWTEWGVIPPPPMELKYSEPWSEWGYRAELIYLEPWTYWTPPAPPMEQRFTEPWSQ